MRQTNWQPNRCGVRCSNCGPTLGTVANIGQGGLRCCSCGRFAEPCETYCAKHEVYWGGLTGYDHCPRCRQERDRQQLIQERQARRADPNKHPAVDAPRR